MRAHYDVTSAGSAPESGCWCPLVYRPVAPTQICLLWRVLARRPVTSAAGPSRPGPRGESMANVRVSVDTRLGILRIPAQAQDQDRNVPPTEFKGLVAVDHIQVHVAPLDERACVHHGVDPPIVLGDALERDDRALWQKRSVRRGDPSLDANAGSRRLALA